MKLKIPIAISIFITLTFVFIHSEFGVAAHCHDHHDLHEYSHLISRTLISKTELKIDKYLIQILSHTALIDRQIRSKAIDLKPELYHDSLNLFVLKLPTFSFLQFYLI